MVAIASATTRSSSATDSVVALNEGFQQGFFWAGRLAFAGGAILALIFARNEKIN